jgi:glycerophosphoryl diester phosphodiesterase
MWPYPKVIAHRGGGTLAPENTLAALRCGWEQGFRAVEFDVMLSRDGVPVLMHDPVFGRTVPGTGNVADTDADALLRMDAGAWFGEQFAGERAPSFEQAVQFCRAHGIWMNMEIKPVPGFEERTGRVAAQYARHLFADEITSRAPVTALPLFSSFSFEALQAAKEIAPEIPRGYLMDTIATDWQQSLRALDAVALHVNQKNLSIGLVNEVKASGYGLFCYTVNEAARAREILRWGVDAFCTDRLDLIGPDFA